MSEVTLISALWRGWPFRFSTASGIDIPLSLFSSSSLQRPQKFNHLGTSSHKNSLTLGLSQDESIQESTDLLMCGTHGNLNSDSVLRSPLVGIGAAVNTAYPTCAGVIECCGRLEQRSTLISGLQSVVVRAVCQRRKCNKKWTSF